jgi:predicted TPR repeat methyltransferase
MATAQAPIKVYPATKDKVRYAAAIRGLTQADVLAQAVDEYVERHHDEFAARIDDARTALLGGENSAVAHMLGVDKDAVDRIAGS